MKVNDLINALGNLDGDTHALVRLKDGKLYSIEKVSAVGEQIENLPKVVSMFIDKFTFIKVEEIDGH